jgi:hypothetical protein
MTYLIFLTIYTDRRDGPGMTAHSLKGMSSIPSPIKAYSVVS